MKTLPAPSRRHPGLRQGLGGGKRARDLSEMVPAASELLCRAHHTVIHQTPWQARTNPTDGRPEFQPPPRGRRLRHAFRERHDERDHWIRERTPRE